MMRALAVTALTPLAVSQLAIALHQTDKLYSPDAAGRPASHGPPAGEWLESVAYPRPMSGQLKSGLQLVKDSACFRALEWCHGVPLTHFNFRTPLTCCDEHGQSPVLTPRPSVGVCTVMTGEITPLPVSTINHLMIATTFEANCHLNSDAEACGPADCEDLELQAHGLVYMLLEVATSREPPVPTPNCPWSRFENSDLMKKVRGELLLKFTNLSIPWSEASSGSKVPMERKARGQVPGEQQTVFTGSVVVFDGPMRIFSRTHNSLYKEGWFSLVTGYDKFEEHPVEYLSSLPYEIPWVPARDFWAYKMDFFRPPEGGPAST